MTLDFSKAFDTLYFYLVTKVMKSNIMLPYIQTVRGSAVSA